MTLSKLNQKVNIKDLDKEIKIIDNLDYEYDIGKVYNTDNNIVVEISPIEYYWSSVIMDDKYKHHKCSRCNEVASFSIRYIDGIEDGIEESLGNYCSNCGARLSYRAEE